MPARLFFIICLSLTLFLLFSSSLPADQIITATSPDKRIHIDFEVQKTDNGKMVPRYRVRFRDQEVMKWSRLGIRLADKSELGADIELEDSASREITEKFSQHSGKRKLINVAMNEKVVRLREKSEPRRRWELVLRATNDGVAFRFRIPEQSGWETLEIAAEMTEYNPVDKSQYWSLPLDSFTTSHEARYLKKAGVDPIHKMRALPLLIELNNGAYAAITEANINEYAGQYLVPTPIDGFKSQLSPLPKEPAIVVRHALPHSSPWRVILVGDRIGALVESDLVLALNEPCAIADTSWIKPGKTTFPWWNGYYEEGVNFKPGLNTATMKHYIDFCAANGIPYHSLDGVGDLAWYGGTIVPYQGADITKSVPEIDLPEVLKYAKSKGVRLRLWMHWQAAEKYMERAFPIYKEWGIEGVMLDFMDRDDQQMNAFLRKAVKLAAENQLTVTLHGCPKPTGLERTYPNLLTHEGVMNLEYDKWDKQGITPEHEVTVPFTRMLAGPLDFHQGSFRTVKLADFKPRNDAPLVIGTPSRTLAGYVVFQNHLSMVADYPSAYRDHPGLPILAAIPTTWDDIKVLDAKVGEYVVIARKSGDDWYVGAMTDRNAREFKLPLTFLAAGDYAAEIVTDEPSEKFGLAIRQETVKKKDTITIKLEPSGGAFIQLKKRSMAEVR